MAQRGKSDWWRAVLGEYPTGVVLIASLDPAGAPVGMVVGSFTAVSQDPPLIAFLPDTGSTTFPMIAAHGRFVASVLGSEHEALCRAFARKDPERFGGGRFTRSVGGIPRLVDAIAWFEARIESRSPVGDHEFVVGAVEDFGLGTADAGLPLLFRRAGYGSFAVPAQEVDGGVLARRLGAADAASDVLIDLADELERQVVVSTVVRESVVVLSAVQPSGATRDVGRRRIGDAFPLAAPIAPLFVAWATPERQAGWIEGARHLIGTVDRSALADLLADVRRRGYGLSAGHTLADRFEAVVAGVGPRRESFAGLWRDIAAERPQGDIEPVSPEAGAVQAPVFGPDGDVELVLTVAMLDGPASGLTVEQVAGAMLLAAGRLTERLGGAVPARQAA